MINLCEVASDWTDYELIDSGQEEKLERFGSYILARPDPRALWKKRLPGLWDKAHAVFVRTSPTQGIWRIHQEPPAPWEISYKKIRFTLRPTEFKHVGIFPEQAANWNWLSQLTQGRNISVLNLFAYTGGATMAVAQEGSFVTHVDSVKSAIEWAHQNATKTGINDTSIRWIIEDAYKFVLKEARRGKKYDGVILDPPRFGRGSKGEVWKLSEDLPKLLAAISTILVQKPRFILLNAYTADLSPLVLRHLLDDLIGDKNGELEHGEIGVVESQSERVLPSGIFARWHS